jgi:transaldolase
VASFFVSRVDTEVDRRLEQIAKQDAGSPTATLALAMRGRAAVAQARLAYGVFLELFAGPRWEALEKAGARPQRPLWASTSTKNPAYPDLVYVDTLVAHDTVNTMPEETLQHYLDHGAVQPISEADLATAEATFESLAECGIDLADVAEVLETEGVAAFAASFDDLLSKLQEKADAIGTIR